MAALDKDTFDGWIVVMLKNVAEAKAMFPQEAPWLVQFETALLTKAQDPMRKLAELGLTPGAPAPGGGQMPGMPPGPPAGMPGMPPGAGLPGMGAPPPTMGGPPMPTPEGVGALMGGMGGPPPF